MSWTPSSWRDHPAEQLPAYPDPHALEMAESCLEASAELASVTENRALSAKLAEVAEGRGFGSAARRRSSRPERRRTRSTAPATARRSR